MQTVWILRKEYECDRYKIQFVLWFHLEETAEYQIVIDNGYLQSVTEYWYMQ